MSNDPKELLARWASDEILDPFGPVLGNGSTAVGEAANSDIESLGTKSETLGENVESDSDFADVLPEPTLPTLADFQKEPDEIENDDKAYDLAANIPIPLKVESEEQSDDHADFETNDVGLSEEKPATQEQAPEITKLPIPTRNTSLTTIGQILAYVGVLSLTLGTTFVLWGYFGDKPNYAPMGWLVMTAGQMLLFLGGVTLVSGGMEQTNIEVASRIDLLGEQILRLEQATLTSASPTQSAVAEKLTDSIETPSEAAA